MFGIFTHMKNIFNSRFLIILILFLIIFLRSFCTFFLFPIISVYVLSLRDSTKFLIGLSLGIYSLFQSILQIPLGFMSDILGRKSIIIFGLCLFSLGSFFCAFSNSIFSLLIGRSLQGSGAISSIIITLLSDLVSKKHNFMVMFFVGVIFGISFISAMILSPVIFLNFGFNFIFWLILIISLVTIVLVAYLLPNTKKKDLYTFNSNFIKIVFYDTKIIIINFSIFLLHFLLTFNFLVLPIKLQVLGLNLLYHWKLYFYLLIISSIISIILIYFIDIKKYTKTIIISSIVSFFISEFIFFNFDNLKIFIFGIQLFFFSFSILESLLPSLINQLSCKKYKGLTMGIFSTSQFIGSAFGGILGGLIINLLGLKFIFILTLLISFLWFLFIIKFYK